MTKIVYEIMQGVGVFFAIYLMLYASFLFFSVSAGAFRLYKRDRMTKIKNELKHNYYMPVSILVPAYNEEVTIVDSVNSLLCLDYRLYEIIIVDDGSKDNTADELISAYNMRLCNRPIHRKLPCKPCNEVYETQIGAIKVTLLCKVNGGKGDALNMGINASQYPYFICIDADSMLQKDSLEKIIQPVLEDDGVVAVGGLIRVAQCAEINDGVVDSYHLDKNVIVCMQVMEYDRSFMASRIFMDLFNGNLIISGAFGLFKKATVIACGGYSADTLGEDMDLVVKLHVYCRNNNMKYSVRYEPSAVCWSQAPTSLRDLAKQRRRWNLGLFQSMYAYRQIFGKLRFGLVSFVSYMYYLIFELLSPFIEIGGMLTIILASCFGLLNFRFMMQYFLLYTMYGAVLTITAFSQRIYTQNLNISMLDIARALLMCVLESGFFKYILTFVRASSFISYKKRRSTWGSIKRVQQFGKKAANKGANATAAEGASTTAAREARAAARAARMAAAGAVSAPVIEPASVPTAKERPSKPPAPVLSQPIAAAASGTAPAKGVIEKKERVKVRRMLFGYSKKNVEKQMALSEAQHQDETAKLEKRIQELEKENTGLHIKVEEYDKLTQNVAHALLDLSAHTQRVNRETEEERKKMLEEAESESRRMREEAESYCRRIQEEADEKARLATEELQNFKDTLARLNRDSINALTRFTKSIGQIENRASELDIQQNRDEEEVVLKILS